MPRFRLTFLGPWLGLTAWLLSSCEALDTGCKGGAWPGLVGGLLLLALVFFIVSRYRQL